jgi:predicted nucleic acid-binding protein
MILYLDASALVKRYIEEEGSVETNAVIDKAEAVGTNLISRAEVAAGIMRSSRLGIIQHEQALQALAAFHSEWESFMRLPVSEGTVARAGDLVRDYDLRGYDAVHLAAAIIWQEAIGESVTLGTFDKKLRDSTYELGIGVWPQNLR